MSDHSNIFARIEQLESAVAGWIELAESSEWAVIAWNLDCSDRDPRQIIAAYDAANTFAARYHHDKERAADLRALFGESGYRRALAVEEGLPEHGPAVVAWLRKSQLSQAADALVAFLSQRRRKSADHLLQTLRAVRASAKCGAGTEAGYGEGAGEGAGAGRDPAEGGQAPKGNRKKRRGRPAVSNPKADQKLYEAWQASAQTAKEFARHRGIKHGEVEAAAKRHRERLRRGTAP